MSGPDGIIMQCSQRGRGAGVPVSWSVLFANGPPRGPSRGWVLGRTTHPLLQGDTCPREADAVAGMCVQPPNCLPSADSRSPDSVPDISAFLIGLNMHLGVYVPSQPSSPGGGGWPVCREGAGVPLGLSDVTACPACYSPGRLAGTRHPLGRTDPPASPPSMGPQAGWHTGHCAQEPNQAWSSVTRRLPQELWFPRKEEMWKEWGGLRGAGALGHQPKAPPSLPGGRAVPRPGLRPVPPGLVSSCRTSR